jgi:hypothetical protein
MFPARLAVAGASLQLGYNRLLLREDGRARALFDNLERVHHGPLDPEFVLLEVRDESGRPKALLVHHAVHAVVLGPTTIASDIRWGSKARPRSCRIRRCCYCPPCAGTEW